MMVKLALFIISFMCGTEYGKSVLTGGLPFPKSCPIPGRRNGVCVKPEKCAIPVHARYFGYFWRRRGVKSFCKAPGRSRNFLVCCLRVRNSNDITDEGQFNQPIWKAPNDEHSYWNGTQWIEDDSESKEMEDIVAADPIYETKCAEYAQIAQDVNSAVEPGAPIFRPMIVGGMPSFAKEFPHMALLGFGTEDNISWRCGGTLISEKFIMTAAHCLYTSDLGDVEFARLGDLNINSQTDDAQPQQFRIVRRFRHPGYVTSSHYNDIALLELEQPVTFTKYVRPACLPSDDDLTDAQLIATGWGALEYAGSTSSNLMKVDLRYYSIDQCKQSFPAQLRLDNGVDGDSQLCAGGVNEQKDTCQGDSGGPLQVKTSDSPKMYEIVGITSFGRSCGIVNMPAVYTRVSFFVPWIEQIVWPNSQQ